MLHVIVTLSFLIVAAGAFGVIAAMIGANFEAIRAALAMQIPASEIGSRRIRTRMRPASYRVMAQVPMARLAA